MNRTADVPVNEDKISGDRRRDRRYEIILETRWKLIRRRKLIDNGTGRTIDMSSGGICIETDRPLPVGLNLELSISWPMLLHNVAPLQLVVAGRIVRSRGTQAAIRIVQHEFRTMGAASEQRVPSNSVRSPIVFLGGGNETGAAFKQR